MRERDVRAVLELVGDAHDADDLGELRTTLLSAIRRVVPADYVSYNEIPHDGSEGIALVAPELPAWAYETWPRYAAQNPLVVRYVATRDGRAYRFSDLVTPGELHRLDLYRELYARIDVEHQIAFCLPAPATLTIGIALSRGGRDFTERDRGLLDLARPHLIQAYRNAELRERARSLLDAVRRGLDDADQALVVLGAGARVAFLSGAAGRLLHAATGADVKEGDVLPDPLARWLREGAEVPLVLGRGRRLVARHLAGRTGEPDLVFLQPGLPTITAAVLRGLGLTAREADVLRLIVLGRGSSEIAAELHISPRTVHKHVEHILAKLGVSSRVEAVATVWAAVGVRPAA